MALYENKKYLKCTCGKDLFEEATIFRVEEAQISSTLSKSVRHKKEEIGKFIRCLSCGKIIKTPIED